MAFQPNYKPESIYAFTPILGRFMAYYVHRPIRPHSLDTVIKLEQERYVNRPDLLALDLYGNEDLFWVVPVRNGLEDPVFGLKKNMLLNIPHPSYIRTLI